MVKENLLLLCVAVLLQRLLEDAILTAIANWEKPNALIRSVTAMEKMLTEME